jgi:hypothetical protein
LKRIELREEEGLRIYFAKDLGSNMEQSIQVRRKMLERVIRTPITLYWAATFIDFVPL